MAEVPRLLRQLGFRRLYLARLASQAGDGIFEASLAGFVLFSPQRATSAGQIATALAVVLVPFSLVGPFAGIVLDRVSRQRVLVISALARSGLLVVLAGLIATGRAGADFYLTALVVFSANRFVLSALSASLPVVVEDKFLLAANSLSTTSGAVATLFGAGIGGGLRAIVGARDRDIAIVALAAAGTYLLAAYTASRLDRDQLGPLTRTTRLPILAEARAVVAEMAAGARHLAGKRQAREALGALTAHRVCYGVSFVATILLYRNYFHTGLRGLGTIFAAGGVGTVAAAFVTPQATRRISKQAWIVTMFALAAFAELAFGLPYTQHSFVVAALVLGFVAQAAKICVDTLVQEAVADEFRGRAFSVYDLLFNVSYVLAAQLGRFLPNSGKSYAALGGIAGGYALTAVGYRIVSLRGTAPATSNETSNEQLAEQLTEDNDRTSGLRSGQHGC